MNLIKISKYRYIQDFSILATTEVPEEVYETLLRSIFNLDYPLSFYKHQYMATTSFNLSRFL